MSPESPRPEGSSARRRRAVLVVAALLLLFAVLPVLGHFLFGYRLSAGERAEIERSWSELVRWAEESTGAPAATDHLAPALALAGRALEVEAEHLRDGDTGILLPGVTREQLPAAWAAAVAALLEWHRRDAEEGWTARDPDEEVRRFLKLGALAVGLAPGEPEALAAVLHLAHVACRRGTLMHGLAGLVLYDQALAARRGGSALSQAALERWSPRARELRGMLARDAVFQDAFCLRSLEDGSWEREFEYTFAASMGARQIRYELLRYRKLTAELLLPHRGETVDFAALRRDLERHRGRVEDELGRESLPVVLLPNAVDVLDRLLELEGSYGALRDP